MQALEREMVDKLATKHDLAALEQRLGHQIQSLEHKLALQLTLRLGAMLAAGFTVMVALLKLLP